MAIKRHKNEKYYIAMIKLWNSKKWWPWKLLLGHFMMVNTWCMNICFKNLLPMILLF
jgi:hypothetical protein